MTTRHILITGASGGLGRALALAYAAPGVRLTLTGRDADRLDRTAQACRAQGADVATGRLDLRDGEGLRVWIRDVDDTHPVDTVIACAGVSCSLGPDGEAEAIADVRRAFAVNALGAVETLSALAERLRRRGAGRLAVVSSLGGWQGMPSSPAYSASKAAARVYGDALRAWLAPAGVRVTVVSPGFVDSPMSRRYRGAKPFTWTPDRAAAHIRAGIERGAARVAFPWLLALGTGVLWLLPPRLADHILRRFFAFRVEPDAESARRVGG